MNNTVKKAKVWAREHKEQIIFGTLFALAASQRKTRKKVIGLEKDWAAAAVRINQGIDIVENNMKRLDQQKNMFEYYFGPGSRWHG